MRSTSETRRAALNAGLTLLLIGTTTSCVEASGNGPSIAIEIANAHLRSEMNDNPGTYRPVVHDDGDAWIVSYHIPRGELGSQPILVVDKATKIVVTACAGQ
jgi:hypothetical protein